MKKILGLDLGTNSIGWALIECDENENPSKIVKLGSRIIPMTQDVLGKFDAGVSISQTAERTSFRGIRRIKERHQLRRERLHRILNILGFLPEHYSIDIDFVKNFGKFKENKEPKLAYKPIPVPNSLIGEKINYEFIFKTSFYEMVEEFKKAHPLLFENEKLVPYDLTIYYLRKKALTQRIEKEELSWLLLNFNQKRGYYQLRGEEEEENKNKLVEYHSLLVTNTIVEESSLKKEEKWYSFQLENGWVYRRSSKTPLDWTGKVKDFIVTTDVNEDGTIKLDKDGAVKRSFRSPSEDDWTLLKKKTEKEIENSGQTVGTYIFNNLLRNPNQKIKGKLITTIERKFYKDELRQILEKQIQFHPILQNQEIYSRCCEELYEINEGHRKSIADKGFLHLFINDIIFYQRPLKSKKSQISDCKFEKRIYLKDGKLETTPLKCAPKSHPLYQEFRLWQFIQNLRIYKIDEDKDVTKNFLPKTEDWESLFEWLNNRKEIDQKSFLKYPPFNLKKNADQYRWNYVEDKFYPCNETRATIISRIEKANISAKILTKEIETNLWHILYSVTDKIDLEKALNTFARKHSLPSVFVDQFKKYPPYKSEYGAYSIKALKKMLPLMRMGKYWSEADIHSTTIERINKIINGEYDEKIMDRVRQKTYSFSELAHFNNLPVWLTSYIVYNRHSEDGDILTWQTPSDIDYYLKNIFKQHSLRNPIVEQVISETLKVVSDIWKYYGNSQENFFDEIHVELGREMKNPADKRKKMTENILQNENTNVRIKAMLLELLNDTSIENVRPYSPTQQEIFKIYEEGALNNIEDIPEDILKISKMAQPSNAELTKYKLWLNQKYRSPYTGEIIPLSKLFTPAYQIEHIIPQSRFFDDSFSNKVICEEAINKLKDNKLGLEFIMEKGGTIVEIEGGKHVTIFTQAKYEEFVRENYKNNRGKLRKLLIDEIPESFVQRQLNDSRYISKVVKNLLSNIVREENEHETVSKNLLSTNGTITTILKQDWGLNDIWNEIIAPRFIRLNTLTNSNKFGSINPNTNKFLPQVPLELQKGFNKKRIDHRHHALDALVIACVTRDHINYLNNESALGFDTREIKEKKRFDLRRKLCTKKYNEESDSDYKWVFINPWQNFAKDAKDQLELLVVSFKKNLRIINKTVNFYDSLIKDKNGKLIKIRVKQTKGDQWAIRKPMHKDTVAGSITIMAKKQVNLSKAIDDWENIVNKSLKAKIKELIAAKYNDKMILKFFKDRDNTWDGRRISKIEVYHKDDSNVASRVKLDESFTEAKIRNSIADTVIQKILTNHLEKYKARKDSNNKEIAPETLAFSPEGIEDLNKNIIMLNGGKEHKPIYKVRTYETKGNKFAVGYQGNKGSKFVEAAKGTNLYFAIYQNDNGKRSFATIPLNIVIERLKQNLSPVPEVDELGNTLLMFLSPNDLVYIPSGDDKVNDNNINFDSINNQITNNIYKMISSTGPQCFFIENKVAVPIFNKVEFSALNKMEKNITGIMIKEHCIKLQVDRLGNIKPI
jgi:CRISPR-associated endonuclease Csn1